MSLKRMFLADNGHVPKSFEDYCVEHEREGMMNDTDIDWVSIPAGQIRPGDRTKWGYGHGMENSFRTVSRVERRGGGIVHVYHRETWEPFHDEYAETYPVTVARR